MTINITKGQLVGAGLLLGGVTAGIAIGLGIGKSLINKAKKEFKEEFIKENTNEIKKEIKDKVLSEVKMANVVSEIKDDVDKAVVDSLTKEYKKITDEYKRVINNTISDFRKELNEGLEYVKDSERRVGRILNGVVDSALNKFERRNSNECDK